MSSPNNHRKPEAAELNDADLDQARGGFTPNTGADKMEFSPRSDDTRDGVAKRSFG